MNNKSYKKIPSYNERLFGSFLRGQLHLGRYYWINKIIKKYDIKAESVLELGCYDGKTINFLPDKPKRYLGLDANWENGLEIASDLWSEFIEYEFRHCNKPEKMNLGSEMFDISICLETLEHVPEIMVADYLKNLSNSTDKLVLISVPNEIGPVFLIKYLVKYIVGRTESFSFSEILNQSLGRVSKVSRNQHKGFSWKKFKKLVSNDFDILRIDGISPSVFGPYLSFGVGFVCKPKNN